ncbi:hypothetical protein EIN_066090 [Entamoeba invadens IP1]|uniref:Rab-GAP TBC domain-containing protein n=1 Tax=Entamoeba invadens IP1 TaxID=370355 RepID=A0A0A1TVC3_ENTIV|nr:hypothetical protein EIN_066090 [Entamoeba invadens IP1]ELP84324.1 hypothetical protein EIN_066090 [Entamoeba invadens IP1]|eukprot:XP_004183670.1 hypothetical protein EIN_066090 [Entamoeba invadens IP1]
MENYPPVPFPKRQAPKQTSLGSFFTTLATNTMNTLSSSLVPHYTYEGNPYIFNTVCDCLNRMDYTGLEYQCTNGIPAELRCYIWYALLLRPTDPWEIRALYSEAQGTQYRSMQSMLKNIDSAGLQEMQEISKIDSKTLRVIECDIVRTFPEGAEYLFKMPEIVQMLKRILIIYSIIHTNRGYFQGLNDIVGLLIVAFLEPRQYDGVFVLPTEDVLFQSESTVYFILESIMEKLYPNNSTVFHVDHLMTKFINTIDDYFDLIAGSQINRPNSDIVKQQTYRWFVCLFSREFHYHMTFAIWDNFIVRNGFTEFIIFFALSMILTVTGKYNTSDIEKFNDSLKAFLNQMKGDDLCGIITTAYTHQQSFNTIGNVVY